MTTTKTTTMTRSESQPISGPGPIIRRVHPHALKMLHGSLPNGQLYLTKIDAGGLLTDLLIALLPDEELRPRHNPVSLDEPIDNNTITAGELIERLTTTSRQRDDLRQEMQVIAELALIASTLADQQKTTILSVIHDRADFESKKRGRT